MHRLGPLKRGDLGRCARLYVTAFNAPPWNDHWTVRTARKRLQDIMDTPRFYGLLLSDGPELLGAVLGNVEAWYDRYHYNLKEMFVLPEVQRSGMGSKMLSRVRQDLIKKDVAKVYLFTSIKGSVSAFYSKNGLTKVKGLQMMSSSLRSDGSRAKR